MLLKLLIETGWYIWELDVRSTSGKMVLAEKLLFMITELIGNVSLQVVPLLLLVILLLWQLKRMWSAPLAAKNPFSLEFIHEPRPLVMQKSARDAVLKEANYFLDSFTSRVYKFIILKINLVSI